MEITNISERQITLVLSPEDAQRLALACQVASRVTGGDTDLGAEIFGANYLPTASTLYNALAIAFECAGMSCVVHSYLDGLRADMPDFTLDNVRAQKIGSPLWG